MKMQKERSLEKKDNWLSSWFDPTPVKFKAMRATNRYGETIEMAETQIGDFKVQFEGTDKETKKSTIYHKGMKLLQFGE